MAKSLNVTLGVRAARNPWRLIPISGCESNGITIASSFWSAVKCSDTRVGSGGATIIHAWPAVGSVMDVNVQGIAEPTCAGVGCRAMLTI